MNQTTTPDPQALGLRKEMNLHAALHQRQYAVLHGYVRLRYDTNPDHEIRGNFGIKKSIICITLSPRVDPWGQDS